MKILLLANHEVAIYNQRYELIEAFLKNNHKVYICSPGGEKIDKLVHKGCHHIPLIANNRHGKNVLEDLKLIKFYVKLMKQNHFDWVFTFNTKPNIYGGYAAKVTETNYIVNITGLGEALETSSLIQKVMIIMYKIALKKANYVFFQNQGNLNFFQHHKIIKNQNVKILPGSGVNTDKFILQPYPSGDEIHFAFISRIMERKGIDLFLKAAEEFKDKYDNVYFHVGGFCDGPYEEVLREYQNKKIIQYHGMIENVNSFLKNIDCVVHPTYYPEGMANIILESAATGRPVITTDRYGCKEAVETGITGIVIEEKNYEALKDAISLLLSKTDEDRKEMGLGAREKMISEFSRELVVKSYLNAIEK